VGTVLVACETVRDEIIRSLAALGLDYPVIWLEGGLHNVPWRLRERLAQILREADGRCDRLLIALGYCGGGVAGLRTGDYETVLPLTDDCLSLLLGSLAARERASKPVTYFLTKGWLSHEQNVVTAYESASRQFDPETAIRLNRILLEGYGRFGLLDTGAYDLEEAGERVRPLAESLGLLVETIPSDPGWLNSFLLGDHGDEGLFLRLPPRSKLSPDDWIRLLTARHVQGQTQLPCGPLAVGQGGNKDI
jgi:hypothetical protein